MTTSAETHDVTEAPEYVHYETVDDGHVAVIRIDRPERKNALDIYGFSQLANCWRRVADDDQVWVAIVTGTDDAFCAGADLKDFIPQVTRLQEQIQQGEVTDFDGVRLEDSVHAVLRDVELYKPVIAAVNGPCVAGGMEMLGGVDIRLACPEAVFGVLEPRQGLFAGGGTTARLPRQIAFPHAMELLLTADPVPAERALAMGLLNEIVPREELLDRALAWARRITKNAPLAVQATKESVLQGIRAGSLAEAYKIEARLSRRVFKTEDAKEGPRAFAEKRTPNWQAR